MWGACAAEPLPEPDPVVEGDRGLCGEQAWLTDDGPDGRVVCETPLGTRIEVYPDSRPRTVDRVASVADAMAESPAMASVVADTTLLVAPPERDLNALPELADLALPGLEWSAIEGLAMYWGPEFEAYAPTVAIRHDSVERWNLGVAHELLHLVLHDLGPEVQAEALELRRAMLAKGQTPAPGADEHELFAYFGQWRLAGYGALIAETEPELDSWLEMHLGAAQIGARGTSDEQANWAIEELRRWFRGN
ncbi:MAG: hypothetical protein AAGA48_14620 [Myxococcota bacterium]